jgi:hypothetical protein
MMLLGCLSEPSNLDEVTMTRAAGRVLENVAKLLGLHRLVSKHTHRFAAIRMSEDVESLVRNESGMQETRRN